MSGMTRTILHLDLDAFYCAVEELNDPSLAGRAFAVGGQPGKRGVVASCSWPARRYGLRAGMRMGEALRLCPHLLVVSQGFSDYSEVSSRVMSLARELTPMVEAVSIDEAFLDVTGLPGDPGLIARALQMRIARRLNLPCSIGAGSSKLIAKNGHQRGQAHGQRRRAAARHPGHRARRRGRLPRAAGGGRALGLRPADGAAPAREGRQHHRRTGAAAAARARAALRQAGLRAGPTRPRRRRARRRIDSRGKVGGAQQHLCP